MNIIRLSTTASLLALVACADAELPLDSQEGTVRTGQVILEDQSRMKIRYTEEEDGEAIFQGDIRLDPRSIIPDGQEAVARGGAIPDGGGIGKRWPDGVIPYDIDSSLSAWQANEVRIAVDHWNQNTVVRLVPRGSEFYHITFTGGAPGGECGDSPVGRQLLPQNIRLSGGCYSGGIIHEIGHAVGLWHEQSRSDRDNYVRVDFSNIPEQWRHNFDRYDDAHIQNIGLYDFGSIMHYIPSAFQIDPNKFTIWAIDPANQSKMGNVYALSTHDKGSIRVMYGRRPHGDFNGDGLSDLMWRDQADGRNWVWTMAGDQIEFMYNVSAVPDTQWAMGGTCDFNGDGKSDILWRHRGTGEDGIWLMNDDQYSSWVQLPTVNDLGWTMEGCGDLDRDGKSDILWRHANGTNSVWFMNGTAPREYALLPSLTDMTWEMSGAGDFNGDGYDDVLWRDKNGGTGLVWFMNGTQKTGQGLIPSEPNTDWVIGNLGDYNGDGRVDIAWRNTYTKENRIWMMNGLQLRQSLPILSYFVGNSRMAAQDVGKPHLRIPPVRF